MPVPRKRTSRARRDSRRAHLRLTPKAGQKCPQCGEPRLPHHVCPTCGNYRGREVIKRNP